MSPVLGPILAQAITFYAGDRTEVRSRLVPDDIYLDIETLPTAEIELRTARTSWSLSYFPTLSFLAVGDPDFGEVVLLQSARASASFRWPRTFLRLSQSGSYGERNFQVAALSAPTTGVPTTTPPDGAVDPNAPTQPPVTPPPGAAPTAPQPLLAEEQTVTYVSLRPEAQLTHLLSRRFSFDILGGYDVSGGMDSTARVLYPLQRGPFAELRLNFRSSPTDLFSTELSGRIVDSTGGTFTDDDRLATLAALGERWTHDFTRSVSGDLSAGVAYTRFETEDSDPEQKLHPVASAGLRHVWYKSQFSLAAEYDVSLSPVIDRNTGAVDDRVQLLAQLTWTREELSFLLNLVGVESLDRDSSLALTSYNASFTMRYAFSPEVAFDTGVRMYWQRAGIVTDSVLGGVLFAGLTCTLPPVRL